MSWQRVPEGLADEDHDYLKIHKFMVTEVHTVLLFLFSESCPKHPAQNLEDYLLRGPGRVMSWDDFKYFFNYSQREILKKDPTGKKFDITLLAAAIPFACVKLTKELDDHITDLRKFRNDLLHKDPGFDVKVKEKELRDLVKKTYLSIGKQYTIDVSNNIQQMEDNADNILMAPLPVPDRVKYQEDLRIFRDEIRADFCIKGKEELRTNHNFSTTTDPASFIPGKEATLKVTVIYTRLDMVVHKLSLGKPDYSIDYEKLLTVLDYKNEIPSIIILEGPPGAGKTTLTKFLHAQWESSLQGGHCSIIDLDKFDLVFPYECSNSSLSSYEDLIVHHLPKSTLYLRNEDIMRSIKQLSILILVDAADDLNSKSEKLLNELFEKHVPESRGKLRIVCTTRPQALRELLLMIQNNNLSKVHTKITGVPSDRRGEFVKRLHDEMINEHQSTEDTEGLVDFLENKDGCLGDHFKFPLMLSLLTYLWAFAPRAVNGISTISKLYLAIHELIQEKLFARLRNHEMMKGNKLPKIKESCNKFLVTLYRESLVTISLDKIIWPRECIDNLKRAANKNGLPDIEVTSAFLSHTCEWTALGYSDQYAGSHKSMVELYAAFYIVEVITGNAKTARQLDLETKLLNGGLDQSEKMRVEEELIESKTITGILKDNHTSGSFEISKYENVLVHLLGLLNNRGKDVLHKFHEEVIKLMKSCRHGLDWFQILSEVECDSSVSKFVAESLTVEEKNVWQLNGNTNIKAAIELIKWVTPKEVIIELVTNSSHLKDLPDLLVSLSKTACIVDLEDKWSFRNPEKSSAELYLSPIKSCLAKKILTTTTTITQLPDVVEHLNLGLLEDPITRRIQDPGLATLTGYFKQLESLGINIKAGAGTDLLPNLPELRTRAGLYLSELREASHIDWSLATLKKLQPGLFNRSRGYGYLGLVNCQLKADQLCELIHKMADENLTIWNKGNLWIHSLHKHSDKDWLRVRQATERNLRCSLNWEEADKPL